MYLTPADSDAGAAPIAVYSIAPAPPRGGARARRALRRTGLVGGGADGGDGGALRADGDVDAADLLLRVAGGPGLPLVDDRGVGVGGRAASAGPRVCEGA